MKIKAIPFSEFSKTTQDSYEGVVISSHRAHQIVDDRFQVLKETEKHVDEAEYLSDEIHLNEDYIEQTKPLVSAMTEFLNEELEWSDGSKNSEEE
jgi:DNA-directed RNA polymerase subunit K/omega